MHYRTIVDAGYVPLRALRSSTETMLLPSAQAASEPDIRITPRQQLPAPVDRVIRPAITVRPIWSARTCLRRNSSSGGYTQFAALVVLRS
jgi:hypothetical protein